MSKELREKLNPSNITRFESMAVTKNAAHAIQPLEEEGLCRTESSDAPELLV